MPVRVLWLTKGLGPGGTETLLTAGATTIGSMAEPMTTSSTARTATIGCTEKPVTTACTAAPSIWPPARSRRSPSGTPIRGGPIPTPTPQPMEVSDVREGLEVPDPDGGAPWVLRRFTGVFGADKRHRANACVQLGREVDGRFGWLDGHDEFTTPGPGSPWSTLCIPPSRLERFPARPRPQPAGRPRPARHAP